MRRRRLQLLPLLALLALLIPAAPVLADADPASDVLLAQDVFLPYQPNTVSPAIAKALNETVSRAHAAGFPVKVALIAAAQDLGAIPNLFGHPQQYAQFLDREISFNTRTPLLVVMPQGLGVAAAGKAPPMAVSGTGADALARAAIPAVAAISTASGHPIAAPPIPAGGGAASHGGPSPLLTFGAPVVLVVLFALAVALARRGGRDGEDDRPTPPPAASA